MSDVVSLQLAAQRSPKDHAVRLALADYLDEAEDHRGAYDQRAWVALDRIRSEPEVDSLRLEWAATTENYAQLIDDPIMAARADLVRVQVEMDQQRRRMFKASLENDGWLEETSADILDNYLFDFIPQSKSEWWGLVVLEDVIWRKGWPAELRIVNWQDWRNDGDKVLEDVPGLDLVHFDSEPPVEAASPDTHPGMLRQFRRFRLEGIEEVQMSFSDKELSPNAAPALLNRFRLKLLRTRWPHVKRWEWPHE